MSLRTFLWIIFVFSCCCVQCSRVEKIVKLRCSCDGGWINAQDYQNKCPRHLHCRQSQQLHDVYCKQLWDRQTFVSRSWFIRADRHRLAFFPTTTWDAENISPAGWRHLQALGVETNLCHISSTRYTTGIVETVLVNIRFSAKFAKNVLH